jgi:D-alanyl-D-alanine carboxypeptidase
MSARLAVSVMSDVVTDVNAAALSQSLARPGQQGSLVRRFPENSDLAGAVAAKTGSLEGVRSLAGVIDTPDRLVFALFVVGSQVTDDTREDIDSLVAEFYVCGENLAHWGPTGEGE